MYKDFFIWNLTNKYKFTAPS